MKKKRTAEIRTSGSRGGERFHIRAVYNHTDYEGVRRAILQRSYLLPVQKGHILFDD